MLACRSGERVPLVTARQDENMRGTEQRGESHVCHLETAGLDKSSLEPSTPVEFDGTNWL